MKKTLLLLLVLALAAGFFASGLHRQLDLDTLKAGMGGFAAWRADSPLLVAALYFAAYVAVTALSLPGAAVMTLAGGALFGLGWGLLIVSFASTIGATLAFLVSRHLLRDSVHARFGERLRAIDQGIARDGAFYLFSLRLVPAFPFFLINLLMGLTPIRTRTFYWVSQLGMLPGTLVYVNAGTELGAVDSLAGVLSPGLVASFVLLGLFPLLARWGVERVQARRVYAGWTRPKRFERNLVVIGAGAAGLVTSYIAAAVKAKVTLVEAGRMGGDCLNTGCVPSKALIRSARLAHQIRHAERYGLEPGEPAIDFRRLMARVRAVIRKIEPHDSVERYTALGVEVLQGRARIVDPWTVEVALNEGGTHRLSTRNIVIATGARPTVPALPGLEAVGYLTSDTLWDAFAELDTPPRRLLVLGGGPIGCELAQACARLGSQVVLVGRAPQLLPREDADVAAFARAALEADGVEVLTGVAALRCEREPSAEGMDKFLVVADPAGGGERRIGFDTLLCAVGRSARLEGFGLEALGIPAEGTVATNDFLQTRYPNILAAGDVAGPFQFTHVAAHQAWHAAVNALFGHLRRFRVDYRFVPHTTFIDPEVARVGLNETEAHARGITFEVTRYGLDDLDRAIADGADHGFVKVLTVPGKDRILGVTIVGEHAAELLAEFVLAMKHGLGLNKVLGTIHTYPTFAEANKYVAGEWKRAHAPQRVLGWLARHHAWLRG
ncbi:hypothetical protein C667_20714 [Thauera phenylacetica B4P]|uniref:Pyridine nucleotide-disulfide oxidoreductase n=1 Tax=Thauera phenylacetica B4P TaxID=1234382 RepID=N6ZLA1_9RHOO|nr:bifunctional TVP38/TMEM64 family protein/FAD-dependent oxidoreductase [Thauera phenylacetica]ENO95103.1 hypothetical protein C667_20714 [Thauera phenylacetica B4P]